VCERSVNISGNALGVLAGRLKFTIVRKRSPPLDHVDGRTGLKLVPPSHIHSHKPSSVLNNPHSSPLFCSRGWPNEVVQAQPCGTTLRDMGTPWTLVWIYILSMLPTCESLPLVSESNSFVGASLRPIRSIGGRGHGEVISRPLAIFSGSSGK
jgi:hypothetical protein